MGVINPRDGEPTMTDQPRPNPVSTTELQARLRAAAEELRGARHIEPGTQQALANLVSELAAALDPQAPCERSTHLAECSEQVIRTLHEPHETSLLAAARDRLEDAAARAEARAPVAAGLARQLVDLLAGIGV